MAKTSSGKKVAKAAKSGKGTRTRSGRTPGSGPSPFPIVMGLVVVLGLVLVVVSRDASTGNTEPPLLGDHWHAAYGVYACDTFLPPLEDAPDAAHHLHTHVDGLIHIHPSSSSRTGADAKLSNFEVGWDLSSEAIELRDGITLTNGDDCNGEPGVVQVASWDPVSFDQFGRPLEWSTTPVVFDGDPGEFRPQDDQLVTIAFAPEGAEIPQPPSRGGLAAPADETPVGPPPPTEAGDTGDTATDDEPTDAEPTDDEPATGTDAGDDPSSGDGSADDPLSDESDNESDGGGTTGGEG